MLFLLPPKGDHWHEDYPGQRFPEGRGGNSHSGPGSETPLHASHRVCAHVQALSSGAAARPWPVTDRGSRCAGLGAGLGPLQLLPLVCSLLDGFDPPQAKRSHRCFEPGTESIVIILHRYQDNTGQRKALYVECHYCPLIAPTLLEMPSRLKLGSQNPFFGGGGGALFQGLSSRDWASAVVK